MENTFPLWWLLFLLHCYTLHHLLWHQFKFVLCFALLCIKSNCCSLLLTGSAPFRQHTQIGSERKVNTRRKFCSTMVSGNRWVCSSSMLFIFSVFHVCVSSLLIQANTRRHNCPCAQTPHAHSTCARHFLIFSPANSEFPNNYYNWILRRDRFHPPSNDIPHSGIGSEEVGTIFTEHPFNYAYFSSERFPDCPQDMAHLAKVKVPGIRQKQQAYQHSQTSIENWKKKEEKYVGINSNSMRCSYRGNAASKCTARTVCQTSIVCLAVCQSPSQQMWFPSLCQEATSQHYNNIIRVTFSVCVWWMKWQTMTRVDPHLYMATLAQFTEPYPWNKSQGGGPKAQLAWHGMALALLFKSLAFIKHFRTFDNLWINREMKRRSESTFYLP